MSFSPSEIESYRQLVFRNVLDGMRELLIAIKDEFQFDVGERNQVGPSSPHFPDTPCASTNPVQALHASRAKHILQRQGG